MPARQEEAASTPAPQEASARLIPSMPLQVPLARLGPQALSAPVAPV